MPSGMNRKISSSLVGAFLLGCAATQIAPLVVPPARAGTSPQRWEYVCKAAASFGDADVGKFTAVANAFGREGWEMTAAGGANTLGTVTWCFKRPLP